MPVFGFFGENSSGLVGRGSRLGLAGSQNSLPLWINYFSFLPWKKAYAFKVMKEGVNINHKNRLSTPRPWSKWSGGTFDEFQFAAEFRQQITISLNQYMAVNQKIPIFRTSWRRFDSLAYSKCDLCYSSAIIILSWPFGSVNLQWKFP